VLYNGIDDFTFKDVKVKNYTIHDVDEELA